MPDPQKLQTAEAVLEAIATLMADVSQNTGTISKTMATKADVEFLSLSLGKRPINVETTVRVPEYEMERIVEKAQHGAESGTRDLIRYIHENLFRYQPGLWSMVFGVGFLCGVVLTVWVMFEVNANFQ